MGAEDILMWNNATPPIHSLHYVRIECIFHLHSRGIHLIDKSILYRFTRVLEQSEYFITGVFHQSLFCCTFFRTSKTKSLVTVNSNRRSFGGMGRKKKEQALQILRYALSNCHSLGRPSPRAPGKTAVCFSQIFKAMKGFFTLTSEPSGSFMLDRRAQRVGSKSKVRLEDVKNRNQRACPQQSY